MGQEENVKTVWISKYALTSGIYELKVDHFSSDGTAVYGKGQFECFHGEGKNWHITEEDAKKRAEEMRLEKIQSLKKQIEKLEKLRF